MTARTATHRSSPTDRPVDAPLAIGRDSASRQSSRHTFDSAHALLKSLGISAGASAPEVIVDEIIEAFRERFDTDWANTPVVLAEQARVAIGDGIGEALRARLVIVMIGERPGLTSPDSLGLYLTYAPRVGCLDSERNCISNVRPEGLPYEQAAHKLDYLARHALRLQLSGVQLKDDSNLLPVLQAD